MKNQFKDFSEILIIGAGISGVACARWLHAHGKKITIVDSRKVVNEKISDTSITIHSEVKFPLGENWFKKIDLLVISPGLSPHPEKYSGLAPMLKLAKNRGVPVFTEVDLFEIAINSSRYDIKIDKDFKNNNSKTSQIIAVTGTNGKTSVVNLLTKLLSSLGIDAQCAGNTRPSLLEAVMHREKMNKQPDFWVLELSSFQLALTSSFSPTYSTILNFSQDHLDWHRNEVEYLESKLKVFGVPFPSSQAVICRDDKNLATKIYEYIDSKLANKNKKDILTFGYSNPDQKTGFGIDSAEKFCYFDATKKIKYSEFPLEAKDLKLYGKHNYSNITFCLTLISQITENFQDSLQTLKNHSGEPHRLEKFLSVKNLIFFNDSKSTNIGATVTAVNSLNGPIILLLGGKTKNQRFDILANSINSRSINPIIFGKRVSKICRIFEKYCIAYEKVDDLKAAVKLTKKTIQKMIKDTERKINILFSPSCSSHDAFESYEQRGDEFKKLIISEFKNEIANA